MKFKIQWYERLPSTNTFLKERLAAESELSSGTVVATHEQTQGRGRRGRDWLSGANQNLTFSILMRGDYELQKLPSAAMAAAIAVADFLAAEGVHAQLKWPNDVLVGGKKICGILSESVRGGMIIGIGLNVNMEDTEEIDQPATSLRIETGERYLVGELLERFLPYLTEHLAGWERGGFPFIRASWEAYVPAIGKPAAVRDGESYRSGILRGFGDNGELLLEENGRVCAVWAGDVSV